MQSFCTLHDIEMAQRESKTKTNADGSYKTYYSHMQDGKMCFGESTSKASTAGRSNWTGAAQAATAPAKVEDEVMKRVDWDRKEFIKGLAVFSSNERQQGMSPVEAVKSSHTFDWMFVAYGDNPNYQLWASEALLRIKKLSATKKNEVSNDMIEAFDKTGEDLEDEPED